MRVNNMATIYFQLIIQIILVTARKSGPYKSSPVKIGPCPLSTTTQPMDKDPPLAIAVELYTVNNYSLARGNMSVFRENSLKKMKVKNYVWEGNNWRVKFQVTSMGCNRLYFSAFLAAANIKYDPKTCTFYKGVYKFGNINLNKLQHTFMNVQEYGRSLWTSEVFSNAGTIFCHQVELNIEADK